MSASRDSAIDAARTLRRDGTKRSRQSRAHVTAQNRARTEPALAGSHCGRHARAHPPPLSPTAGVTQRRATLRSHAPHRITHRDLCPASLSLCNTSRTSPLSLLETTCTSPLSTLDDTFVETGTHPHAAFVGPQSRPRVVFVGTAHVLGQHGIVALSAGQPAFLPRLSP